MVGGQPRHRRPGLGVPDRRRRPAARVLDDSCGSVWSSGTVLPDLGLVVFGTADCNFGGIGALRRSRSSPCASPTARWPGSTTRSATTRRATDDFGATANAGSRRRRRRPRSSARAARTAPTTRSTPRTGRLRWSTNVVFGGFSGGFIATTAYDGQRVYGATGARGLPPDFEAAGPCRCCDPSDPRDTRDAEPDRPRLRRARRARCSGRRTTRRRSRATTVAGGMTFNGLALAAKADRRCATPPPGGCSARSALPQANWSGIATVGDALVSALGIDLRPPSVVGHRGADAGRGAARGPPLRLRREPGRLRGVRQSGGRRVGNRLIGEQPRGCTSGGTGHGVCEGDGTDGQRRPRRCGWSA